MINYDFATNSPLTTTSELRAWAVAATAASSNRRSAPLFLLATAQRLGTTEWYLSTRERTGLDRRVGGELLTVLQRDWPTSTRTGGRTHLTAFGVVRLVAGGKAAKEDAAAAKAEVDRHRREESRVSRLDDAIERAFPGTSDAACASQWKWRETRHDALNGRTPAAAARESDAGLEAVLAALEPLIAEREAKDSAGWSLDLLPEEAARLGSSFWLSGTEEVTIPEGRTVVAHLYELGHHVGLVQFHGVRGHPHAIAGRHCSIAWLLGETEAAAAHARLSAVADAFVRARTTPRQIGVPDRTPCEAFLTRHLLPLGRRVALADIEPTR